MMPARNGGLARPPSGRSSGPRSRSRPTVAASNRPNASGGAAAGAGGQLRGPSEPRAGSPATDGAQPSPGRPGSGGPAPPVRARFSIFRPAASSTASRSPARGAHCRGGGRPAPRTRPRGGPRSTGPCVRRDTGTGLPAGPSCSRAASSRTTCAALPRASGQGPSPARPAPTATTRSSAPAGGGRRPPGPLLSPRTSWDARFMTGYPDPGPPATVMKAR